MKQGLFISATNTGVGKTILSACITRILTDQGHKTIYYKPAQTGAVMDQGEYISTDCRFVDNVIDKKQYYHSCSSYLFKRPASPHYAAQLENKSIQIKKIESDLKKLMQSNDYVIVEGAGGLYVPLNDDCSELMAHIPAKVPMNILLAANAGLGTINDVSLSWNFIKQNNLHLSAIILIYHGPEPTDIEEDNMKSLKKITGISEIHFFPAVKNVDTDNNQLGDILKKVPCFPNIEKIKKWIHE